MKEQYSIDNYPDLDKELRRIWADGEQIIKLTKKLRTAAMNNVWTEYNRRIEELRSKEHETV